MEKLCKGMERRRDTPMDLRTLNTEGRKIEIQRAGWRTKLVNGNTTGSPTRPTSSTASNGPPTFSLTSAAPAGTGPSHLFLPSPLSSSPNST